MRNVNLLILFLSLGLNFLSQGIPTKESNIDYIVTYGVDAKKSLGDDDNSQVFFITVPPRAVIVYGRLPVS